MDRKKINLVGGGFQHSPSTSGYDPLHIEWVKNGFVSNLTIYVDYSIKTETNKDTKNYGWLCESKTIIPDLYDWVKNNIGYLKIKEKQFNIAENYFKESLQINLKTFGASHISIAENYIGMATLEKEQKLSDEAKANYQKALTIYIKLFKGKHPKISYLQNEISLIKN